MLSVQFCLTLWYSMDCSPPGSSVHGILQARTLEWIARNDLQGIFLTQGSNLRLYVPCIGRLASLSKLVPPGKLQKAASFAYNASVVVHLVKNPPAMWETWVQSLGWEDPLKKGMVTHSSILAWNSMDRMGSQRAGHNWATFTLHTLRLAMQTPFSLMMPLYFVRSAFMYTSNLHHTQCLKIYVFKDNNLISA